MPVPGFERRFATGINDVRGDLTIRADLGRYLDGVDAVFLVWSAPAGAASAAVDVPRLGDRPRRGVPSLIATNAAELAVVADTAKKEI